MSGDALPVWAQNAGLIAVALVSAIIGVLRYLKTEAKVEPKDAAQQVVAASFVDSKLLKELVEALREHQEETAREIKKLMRTIQDCRDAVQEGTEATILQTDSAANLLKFLSRKSGQQRLTYQDTDA